MNKGRVVICVPSLRDVTGAGGVAPRWRLYVSELENDGYECEVWCVDSLDEGKRIPRCVHPFYPKTFIDLPSPFMMARLWLRLKGAKALVATDLFNDVNLGLLAFAANVRSCIRCTPTGRSCPVEFRPWRR